VVTHLRGGAVFRMSGGLDRCIGYLPTPSSFPCCFFTVNWNFLHSLFFLALCVCVCPWKYSVSFFPSFSLKCTQEQKKRECVTPPNVNNHHYRHNRNIKLDPPLDTTQKAVVGREVVHKLRCSDGPHNMDFVSYCPLPFSCKTRRPISRTTNREGEEGKGKQRTRTLPLHRPPSIHTHTHTHT
jgi:hypothetical protein